MNLKFRQLLVYTAFFILAALPIWLFFSYSNDLDVTILAMVLNLIAWIFGVVCYGSYCTLRKKISDYSELAGLSCDPDKPVESISKIVDTISRKESILNLKFDDDISDSNARSKNLNKLLNTVSDNLNIASAEFTLIDDEKNLYHGACLVGVPFSNEPGAAFQKCRAKKDVSATDSKWRDFDIYSYEEGKTKIIVSPVNLGRLRVGFLRFKFEDNYVPDETDYRVIVLALIQCTRILIVDDFTTQLIRMRENSESEVKSKSGFLAQLSHEFRGPLGIILNAVELVLEGLCGDINPDQDETLSLVKRNVSHLLELVNDVLDFAKAEAGKMNPNKESVSVNDTVEDVVNVVRALADSKGHKLSFSQPMEEFFIEADKRHIRQILINLLTNAIKYTPENGKIDVWCDDLNGTININVRDNGIGIKKEDRDKVFKPFERIESDYVREQRGTGIGMSLTSQLISINGGKIDFVSDEGEGSHFWVSFKHDLNHESNALGDADGDAEAVIDGNGCSVYILAGSSVEGGVLGKYLEKSNFNVSLLDSTSVESNDDKSISNVVLTNDTEDSLNSLTETAKEKLARLASCDVLVVDEKFIPRDADLSTIFDSLRDFASHDRFTGGNADLKVDEGEPTSKVPLVTPMEWKPIVYLSGDAFQSDIEKVIRAGADLCITKPLSLNKLATHLKDISQK